jgi:hypothetical protein
MNTTKIKREKIYIGFEEELYNNEGNLAIEKVNPLNKSIEELETIIKKPISNYKVFSKDILGFSIKEIKKTFPKPFELDLGDEATFKMLSIDLTNLKKYAKHWDINTEYTMTDGYGLIEIDQERFNQYVETEEQFTRYDFAIQAIDTIEKAVKYSSWLRPQDLASYYRFFIESSFETEGNVKLSVRNAFVLNGN